MSKMKQLNFQPLKGLSSRHLQTILHVYFPTATPPPAQNMLVSLGEDSHLSCEVSTPPGWTENDGTVALVHGLGGSHASNYMVRLARKLYLKNQKVVRINLRGCGSGRGLSRLPYNAGTSSDIRQVLEALKRQNPASEIILIGFSLGGNIILKLAGELGEEAKSLVKIFIAVCAPLDLAQTLRVVEKKRHAFYHSYYLKNMCLQAPAWIDKRVRSIYEFDEMITAPLWGYRGAHDYYHQCSSIRFLPKIQHDTHVVFAEDDPFVPLKILKDLSLSEHVNLWISKYGGHMGFLGREPNSNGIYWMDHLLLNWIDGDFTTNHAAT